MPEVDKITAELIVDGKSYSLAMQKAGDKADSTANRIGKRFEKLGRKMQSIGKNMALKLSLPLLAAAALVVKAHGTQEDAEIELQAALANTGDLTDKNFDKFKKYASEIQKVTKFGDELVLSQLALGRNMGIPLELLEASTTAAIGLAAAYKIDLKAAMQLVAKAQAGQTGSLSRYGIIVDQSKTKQEQFNQVLKLGADKFNIAKANAVSMTGNIVQMMNAVGDVSEVMGKKLAPKVTEISEGIKKIAEDLQKLDPFWFKAAAGVGVLAAALGPLIFAAGSATVALASLKIVVGGALLTKMASMAKVVSLIALKFTIFAAVILFVKANFKKLELGIGTVIAAIFAGIADMISGISKFAKKLVEIFPGAKKFFGDLEKASDDFAQAANEDLVDSLKKFNEEGSFTENTLKEITSLLGKVSGAFGEADGKARKFLDNLNDKSNAAKKKVGPTLNFFQKWFEKLGSTAAKMTATISNSFIELSTSMVTSLAQGTFDAGKVFLGFLVQMLTLTVKWAVTQLGVFQALAAGITAALTNPLVAIGAIAALIGGIAVLSSQFKNEQEGALGTGPQLTQPPSAVGNGAGSASGANRARAMGMGGLTFGKVEVTANFPNVTEASPAQMAKAGQSLGLATIKNADRTRRLEGLRGTRGI